MQGQSINSTHTPNNQDLTVAEPVRYIFGKTIFGKTGIARMTFDVQNIILEDHSGEVAASWPLQETLAYSDNALIGTAIKYGDQRVILNPITWHPLLYGLPNFLAVFSILAANFIGNLLFSMLVMSLVLGYSLGIFFYHRQRAKASGLNNLSASLSAYGFQKKFFV